MDIVDPWAIRDFQESEVLVVTEAQKVEWVYQEFQDRTVLLECKALQECQGNLVQQVSQSCLARANV